MKHALLTSLFVSLVGACSYDWSSYEAREASSAASATASSSSGAGGAAASSSTSSTSSTSSSSVGAGGGKEQDCLDGADDDQDGLADCADPDCTAGYECVDAAPPGWTGYARLHTAPSPAVAPTCPDGSTPLVSFLGPTNGAQCTPCSCTWSDAACTAPEISCWFGVTDCTGTAALVVQSDDGTCVADPLVPSGDPGPGGSCMETDITHLLDPGGCVASGGQLTGAAWALEVHACTSTSGAGCGGGQVCVPRGGGDYTGEICVSQSGSAACPNGWTTVLDTFTGGADTRACSACGCGSVLGTVTCNGGSNVLYDQDACDDGTGHITVDDDVCVVASNQLDANTASISPVPGVPLGGTCAPATGGSPSGSVQPTGPTRYCCK